MKLWEIAAATVFLVCFVVIGKVIYFFFNFGLKC